VSDDLLELKWALAWGAVALFLYVLGHPTAAMWALVIGGLAVPVIIFDLTK